MSRLRNDSLNADEWARVQLATTQRKAAAMPTDALADFDIDDADLPAAIADQALTSGGYP